MHKVAADVVLRTPFVTLTLVLIVLMTYVRSTYSRSSILLDLSERCWCRKAETYTRGKARADLVDCY